MVLDQAFLERNDRVLIEAAVVERLRRDPSVTLHPRLVHATLLYEEGGRTALETIYRSYVDVSGRAGVPLILCTPTWRANRERVEEAGLEQDVNGDAVRLLKRLLSGRDPSDPPVFLGGLIGCKNDCYRPDEGLSADDSREFHAWQVERLARAGVDFLIAETLPCVEEAIGIANAMAATGRPFVISFVIDRHGRVLDGSKLEAAIVQVDAAAERRPLGFMVNCAHPSFLCASSQPSSVFDRLIGYQANASALDHADLDGAPDLHEDDLAAWGREMLTLNRRYGVRIVGGCCGTGVEHLEFLAKTD